MKKKTIFFVAVLGIIAVTSIPYYVTSHRIFYVDGDYISSSGLKTTYLKKMLSRTEILQILPMTTSLVDIRKEYLLNKDERVSFMCRDQTSNRLFCIVNTYSDHLRKECNIIEFSNGKRKNIKKLDLNYDYYYLHYFNNVLYYSRKSEGNNTSQIEKINLKTGEIQTVYVGKIYSENFLILKNGDLIIGVTENNYEKNIREIFTDGTGRDIIKGVSTPCMQNDNLLFFVNKNNFNEILAYNMLDKQISVVGKNNNRLWESNPIMLDGSNYYIVKKFIRPYDINNFYMLSGFDGSAQLLPIDGPVIVAE